MSEQAQQILEANKEVLEQGIALLTSLVDEQYTRTCEPWLSSTIGQHFRHIVDMYLALMSAMESDYLEKVDYDYRRRGSRVELQVESGLEALRQIIHWLDRLEPAPVAKQVLQLQTEVSLQQSAVITLDSSLVRELVFVASHAVHHYALIKVLVRHQGLCIAENFGVAPATASYLRSVTDEHGAPECVR